MEKHNDKKSGFVTIIGRPNVGKSTIMNRMIGEKIAITSDKPQTTRSRIKTVYTDDRGQIVFLDTPGMHQARTKLGEYMVEVIEKAIEGVDLIVWMEEAGEYIGPTFEHIAGLLKNKNCPILLAINKIDLLEKKELLLAEIDKYRKVFDFNEIIPVSALDGSGVDELMDNIFKYLPVGPMYYDEDTLTDEPVRAIAAEIIREKALSLLSDEVPHGIAVTIESFKQRKKSDVTDIEASIICERDSHKRIIIGKGGAMIKRIGTAARMDIEKLVEGRVFLQLFVKVRKDWRDSDTMLKNFGYYSDHE